MTLERVRYFAGQLLGPDDFEQEQRYFREKARRHNRMLHGWGVVCGLNVHQVPGSCEVTIEPGYALDPHGEEIVVERAVVVDLRREPAGQPLYVAIGYAECPARPVVIQGDPHETEYTRARESVAVAVLTELPATYSTPDRQSACPEPPTDPWVVVALVVLGPGPELASLDSVTHRRQVPVGPA